MLKKYVAAGVTVKGCTATRAIWPEAKKIVKTDYAREYLGPYCQCPSSQRPAGSHGPYC